MRTYHSVPLILPFMLLGMLAGCSRRPEPELHSADIHIAVPQPSEQDHTDGHITGYAGVQLDPEGLERMGVVTQAIGYREFTHTIRTVGVVAVDETRVATVQTKFSGWIEDLYVDFIGKQVERGQPLFSVYSPELVASQQEYLLALRNLEITPGGGTEADDWAHRLAAASRTRLERWDIPGAEIELLERDRVPRRTLVINSPRRGTVLSKTAVQGMNVEPGMNMFVIADLSTVWVQADLYERDLLHIRAGQKCSLAVEAMPGRVLNGVVDFISPVVDEATRTVKVRLKFVNRDGVLKPGMYGTVEVTHELSKGLALPEEALIDTGKRKIVFVAAGEGRFEPREVEVGNHVDAFYQVLSGLSPNDVVAIGAQFLLDSESRLRAAGGKVSGHGGGHQTPGESPGKGKNQ
jgi:membrane fusion protein, copper/silver efflux system